MRSDNNLIQNNLHHSKAASRVLSHRLIADQELRNFLAGWMFKPLAGGRGKPLTGPGDQDTLRIRRS